MSKHGSSFGIRSNLPAANKERRGLEHDYSAAGYEYLLNGVGSMTIGRFLLSKSQAKANPDRIDNGLVDVWKNLAEMNRHRGIAVNLGSVMLTYVSADEFQNRFMGKVRTEGLDKRLTPKGLKLHMHEVKQNVAKRFRAQSEIAAGMQDDVMKFEQQQERERMVVKMSKLPTYAGMTKEELYEEIEDVTIKISDTSPKGFKLTQKVHFTGDTAGVKLKQRDERSGALLQTDIDRVNDSLFANGLISSEHPELRTEDVSTFVPLMTLTMNPDQARDELYLPVITSTYVPFQELGIHKIQ